MGVVMRLSAAFAALMAAAVFAAPAADAAGAGTSGRGYEQVSAQDKNGSDGFVVGFGGTIFESEAFPVLLSDDGNAVLYGANGAFGGAPVGNQNAYRADRGASGWATTPISPPAETVHPNISTFQMSLDGSDTLDRIVFGIDYSTAGSVTSPDLTVLSTRQHDGTVTKLSLGSLGGTGAANVSFQGMSRDGMHAVFGSGAALEPDAPDLTSVFGAQNLYERDFATNTTQLVSVLPNGSAAVNGGQLGMPTTTSGTTALLERLGRGAVSDDGSRIFFTVVDTQRALYARVDGVRTLALSSIPPGAGPVGATFEGATPDGAHVFFTDDAQLTGDAPASGTSLYRYDMNADGTGGTLAFVAGGMDAPGTTGYVGGSDDGTILYFVSHDALAGAAIPGDANLYVEDHGAVSFLGALSASDAVTTVQDSMAPRLSPQARVTPDGRHLLLQSFAQLDPAFDNANHGEIYLYTLGTSEPACISCGSAPATADADLTTADVAAAPHLSRNITDDASWIFFETGEGLVPQDQNHRVDVYQWHDGQRALVSSGAGGSDQHFFTASRDGRDVLFSSYERLAASDTDAAGDIYDARLGGGFPSGGAGGPAPCGGEDCRTASAVPPAGVTPGTDAFASAWPLGPAPRVHVVGARARGRGAVTLIVSVNGAGRIRLAGRGVVSRSMRASAAGRHDLRLRLTRARLRALARGHAHGTVRVRVRVSFRASAGRLASTVVVASVKA